MFGPASRQTVRLAELVALLSLGTDLGLGQPMEHMIRACLIALRMAERLGLDVVREAAPAVDLHHRQPLAVFGLEGGIARDVDLAQLEPELLLELCEHAAGALAEMAARGVVQHDLRYG